MLIFNQTDKFIFLRFFMHAYEEDFKLRISNNFINNKTSFGYDKKLHSELKERLASHSDSEWAKDLSTLNNYANRLEGRVVRESKNSKKDNSKYEDYLDIFLNLKNVLAGFISITFTDMNFASLK